MEKETLIDAAKDYARASGFAGDINLYEDAKAKAFKAGAFYMLKNLGHIQDERRERIATSMMLGIVQSIMDGHIVGNKEAYKSMASMAIDFADALMEKLDEKQKI